MRFSIITPSLNQGPYIADCLSSVRQAAGQSGLDVEHLVVDGRSTDCTVDILRSQHFARWISEPDSGQTAAINKGLRQASGDIFAYLCADDMLEPGALAAVDAAFRLGADVVYGDGYFLEGSSGWKRLKHAGVFSRKRLEGGNFLIQPAVFWRNEVTRRHGLLDEQLVYCMDHEYWLRISRDTSWRRIDLPLATCRLHSDAKTSRALATAWREAATMQAAYGIWLRPALNAVWMSTLGAPIYRLKRISFEWLGNRRRK